MVPIKVNTIASLPSQRNWNPYAQRLLCIMQYSSNLIHIADDINCFAFFFQENIQTIQILLKKYG